MTALSPIARNQGLENVQQIDKKVIMAQGWEGH